MAHVKKGEIIIPIIVAVIIVVAFITGRLIDKETAKLEVKIEKKKNQREIRSWKHQQNGPSAYSKATQPVGLKKKP